MKKTILILVVAAIYGCKKDNEPIDSSSSGNNPVTDSKTTILTSKDWRIIFHENGLRRCSDNSQQSVNFSNIYSDSNHLLTFNSDGTGQRDGQSMTWTYNESNNDISIKDDNNSNTYKGKVIKIESNDLRIDVDVSDVFCPNGSTAYGYNVYNSEPL